VPYDRGSAGDILSRRRRWLGGWTAVAVRIAAAPQRVQCRAPASRASSRPPRGPADTEVDRYRRGSDAASRRNDGDTQRNTTRPAPAGGDFNSDGVVNIQDLAMMLNAFGTNCPF